jgi:hypothetical protein
MTEEDEEFNRIEREASLRKAAVAAAVAEPMQKPMHPEIKKMYEDYFDRCFRASPVFREWVGLTYEEVLAIGRELGLQCRLGGNPNIDIDYARAIEAKLKEKNEM